MVGVHECPSMVHLWAELAFAAQYTSGKLSAEYFRAPATHAEVRLLLIARVRMLSLDQIWAEPFIS